MRIFESEYPLVTVEIEHPEDDAELPSLVLSALCQQMNLEFYSSFLYRAMASWCDNKSLLNIAKYYEDSALEEYEHAVKFEKFILDIGGVPVYGPVISEVIVPDMKWSNLGSILEDTVVHEEHVTQSIDSLFELAGQVQDKKTKQFLLWFIEEQIEENKEANDVYALYKASKCDNYLLNRDIADILGDDG